VHEVAVFEIEPVHAIERTQCTLDYLLTGHEMKVLGIATGERTQHVNWRNSGRRRHCGEAQKRRIDSNYPGNDGLGRDNYIDAHGT